MRKIYILLLIIFIIISIFTYCKTKPDTKKDYIKITKNIKLPMKRSKNNALVYILRPSSTKNEYSHDIYINDPKDRKNFYGSVKGNQYIYFYISSGKYRIYSLADNVSWIDINLKNNNIYFIELITEAGIDKGESYLKIINIYKGKWQIKNLIKGSIEKK
jgi:uncharacterized protein YxeA